MPFTADSLALTDFMSWEGSEEHTREQITILAGSGSDRVLQAGMVIAVGSSAMTETSVADAGNTGNGAMGTVTSGVDAKVGTYELVCISTAADAGDFRVTDPDGFEVVGTDGAPLTAGSAFTSTHFSVTLADGATDFVVGDRFRIIMSAPVFKYVRHETTATDGSEVPAGILLFDITAVDGTDNPDGVAVLRGPAIINSAKIIHDANATAAEQEAVLAALEAKGIVARPGVGTEVSLS